MATKVAHRQLTITQKQAIHEISYTRLLSNPWEIRAQWARVRIYLRANSGISGSFQIGLNYHFWHGHAQNRYLPLSYFCTGGYSEH
jgi:hypothetical protein